MIYVYYVKYILILMGDTMKNLNVALFCRADAGDYDEITRQINVLEKYASMNGMDISATFIDESSGGIDLHNEVHFQMLCAAKQKEFDCVLLEAPDIFPQFDEQDIPEIRLYSVSENISVKAGRNNETLFDTLPAYPQKSVLYCRYQ
jgi:hypothetical protein